MEKYDENAKRMVDMLFGMRTSEVSNEEIPLPIRFCGIGIQTRSNKYIPEMYVEAKILSVPIERRILEISER